MIHRMIYSEHKMNDLKEKKLALRQMVRNLNANRKSVMLKAFYILSKLPPKPKPIKVHRSKSPLRKSSKSPLRKSPRQKSPSKFNTISANSPKNTIPKSPISKT